MSQVQVPTGTVTFLFSDIEGSTRMWESHTDSMRVGLARHDALMRDAIAQSNGYVFKTVGDAFYAAFATAPEALKALVDAQSLLQTEIWPEGVHIKVRMAVYTGAVESRDNDYFGPALNRVARLLSTGHGGQGLLSQTTYDLVRDSLPDGVSLKDLGIHQLKDLARPEQLFQVVHPQLESDFAPIRSLSTHPNNLPQQLTSFVGREKESSELHTLIQKHRLVTLTGSGGTGKSRLSLQVAANCLEQFPDGVWLVDLAPLADPALVASTIAADLQIKEEAGRPLLESLEKHLKDKKLLILLDNCEHLLESFARVSDQLLRSCLRVQILATSRESIGLGGEQAYRVPSLSLPNPKVRQTVESLNHFESGRLFIDRAVRARADFTVTNDNAPAVASLCCRLDGIPLAIELAAARTRSLSVEEIEHRLDQRFRLLTGGVKTALPRQQTLQALVDWSYDLLNPSEKSLLGRLSVFAGGWTLAEAEAVCSGVNVDEWEVLDLLTALCDKSLAVSDHRESESRYHFLETVRQYAKDRLRESGQEPIWRDRHLDYYLAFAEEAETHFRGPEVQLWLEKLEHEHENLRAAFDWSLEGDHLDERCPRLALPLAEFWNTRGYSTEGRERVKAALLTNFSSSSELRAKLLNRLGHLSFHRGDYEAGVSAYAESLAIHRTNGNRRGVAGALGNLGNVAFERGNLTEALPFYQECLEISQEIGYQVGVLMMLNNLGNVSLLQNDFAVAKSMYERGLAIAREVEDSEAVWTLLNSLGTANLWSENYVLARSCLAECLAICSQLGDVRGIASTLEPLAELAAKTNRGTTAARLWGAAEKLREEAEVPLPLGEDVRYAAALKDARQRMGDDGAFDGGWAEGRAMTVKHAIEIALYSSIDDD